MSNPSKTPSPFTPPKQYIQGWVEFYKLKFKVTPDTLIPRPETELLVDEVIAHIKRRNHPERTKGVEGSPKFTVLDIGTGAGNIAISLACNLPGCSVNIIATEVSQSALEVAKQNAKFHKVEDKVEFLKSNLLTDLNYTLIPKRCTLIIVTNLPYIPSARIPYLDSSVKDFEPHVALDGGEDGFELYRKLFQQIKEQGLKPNLVLGEIDYTHGQIAHNEAYRYFPNSQVEVKTDLAHKQRILTIQTSSDQ